MTMNSLRGIWVLSFYGVSTALLTSLSLLVSIWSEEGARAFARVWAKANLWVAGIKVEVAGKENLPIGSSAGNNECGFIIAANHTSAADIFAILAGLRLDICWVARMKIEKPGVGRPLLGPATKPYSIVERTHTLYTISRLALLRYLTLRNTASFLLATF